MQALKNLEKTKKVTLIWIPGHQGLFENEITDAFTKKGAAIIPEEQVVGGFVPD